MLRWIPACGLVVLLHGCVAGRGRVDSSEFLRGERGVATPAPPAARLTAADEAGLAKAARLEDIVRIVLARSPEIDEATGRVRAALERVPAAGRLPDPELEYEQWGVPLKRPYALDDAETL